ncbi:MAG: ATP-binding protein [Prevotella sp.]|nr:ATP-binding protein [Prevotella sp.]
MTEKAFLEQLISEGEHQQQDFKYKIQDARKLAKSVSAFANTAGGRLLIGVRDDGVLSGVRSDEEIYMMHKAACQCCMPASEISFRTCHADGRIIVIATIPPAPRRPVTAIDDDGRRLAYVRIHDENIVASPVHLEIWRQERQAQGMMRYADKEAHFIEVLRSQPPLTLNRIVRLTRTGRYRVIGMLARLIRYELVDCTFDGHSFLFALKP